MQIQADTFEDAVRTSFLDARVARFCLLGRWRGLGWTSAIASDFTQGSASMLNLMVIIDLTLFWSPKTTLTNWNFWKVNFCLFFLHIPTKSSMLSLMEIILNLFDTCLVIGWVKKCKFWPIFDFFQKFYIFRKNFMGSSMVLNSKIINIFLICKTLIHKKKINRLIRLSLFLELLKRIA